MGARKLCTGLATLALLWLTGCGVNGQWSLSSVDPTAARRDFQLQSLTLQRDGSFYAEELEGGDIRTTSGTYTYKSGKLRLVAHDGEAQTYDAKMHGGDELVLERNWDGGTVEAKFVRKPQ